MHDLRKRPACTSIAIIRDVGHLSDPHAFQEHPVGYRVALSCDNLTVVTSINKQGATVPLYLCLLEKQFCVWMGLHYVELATRFTIGRKNMMAEQLSHQGQMMGTVFSSSFHL